MNHTIRTARFTDADNLAALLREMGWFEIINSKNISEGIQHIENHLAECLADESHSVYVSVTESNLIGYISVHWLAYLNLPGPEGFISELFVLPSAEGQGVGTALLKTIEKEALERGAYRLSLNNDKNVKSHQSQYLQKRGWEENKLTANLTFILPID
ncbi:MAG: GNAT family N-acetyltransferase [Chloroflexota bacterium]